MPETQSTGTTRGDGRRTSLAERERSPVFVVGVPRSGTTALRNTLERHPRFAPRTRGTAETRVFARPERIERILEPEGAPLLEFYLDDRSEARVLLASLAQLRVPWHERLSFDPFVRAGHPHRIRLFFHHARAARGVARLLEKTPAHALHLREVFCTYPRARVVACVRHPVDVYSSYRKRLSRVRERDRYRDGLEWLDAPPADFARSWRACVDAILGARERRPTQVRVIDYDALTRDPEAELRALCAFVDEPFEAGPLLEDVEVRRDEHGSPRLRARLAPNEKDWRAFLSEADAAAVERSLAEAMSRLGYPRYSAGDPAGTSVGIGATPG